MAHKALGRGLDALFSSNARTTTEPPVTEPTPQPAAPENNTPADAIRQVPVDSIKPNRHQPRTDFDPVALEELSQSIKQHGLAQPLLVTESGVPGQYELVVGERRLRASKLAGLATVPCTVKKLTNRERFEIALIENLQRQDLNALEEAVALDGLMKEYTLTQDEVASTIGKSRSSVANVLRLLRLHDDVQAAIRNGSITEGHAKVIAGIPEHSEQLRLLAKILSEKLSVRDLEALIAVTKIPKKNGTAKSAAAASIPEAKHYEEQFQRQLGRRVEIVSAGKKGWLRMEFYSPADLDLLCQNLGLLKKGE